MLQKIGFTLLCATLATAISIPAYATTVNTLRPGITLEYDLQPHDPQVFVNYVFWPVEANCKVATEEGTVNLFVEAIAKKGKINDVPITAGETLTIQIHDGESFKINADPGAKVQITNLSDHVIHATCSS